jgi:hypothetical protein
MPRFQVLFIAISTVIYRPVPFSLPNNPTVFPFEDSILVVMLAIESNFTPLRSTGKPSKILLITQYQQSLTEPKYIGYTLEPSNISTT